MTLTGGKGVIHDLVPYLVSNFIVLALVTFFTQVTAGVATLLLGAS